MSDNDKRTSAKEFVKIFENVVEGFAKQLPGETTYGFLMHKDLITDLVEILKRYDVEYTEKTIVALKCAVLLLHQNRLELFRFPGYKPMYGEDAEDVLEDLVKEYERKEFEA